jgi:hypothetical protein
MHIEAIDATTIHLTVNREERRALLGAFGWITAGPFAAGYEDLWSARPEWSRSAAEAVAARFSDDADGLIVEPTELELLTVVLETALDGDRPLPRDDWRTLTTASRETAVRLAGELRAAA